MPRAIKNKYFEEPALIDPDPVLVVELVGTELEALAVDNSVAVDDGITSKNEATCVCRVALIKLNEKLRINYF